MNIYLISLPFTSIISLLLGSFVLSKNPKSAVNVTWFLSCLSVTLWSLFFCLMITSKDADTALIYARLSNISAAYISAFLFNFALAITETQFHFMLWLAYTGCFLSTIFGLSDYFLTVRPISVFNFYPKAGLFYYVHTFNFFFFFICQQYIFIKSLKRFSDEKRNQIKYIIFALSLGYAGGALTFLPVFGININPLSAHFIWLYAVIISYAILRHQLMDIRIIIRKSIIYALLVGMITLIYFGFVFLIGVSFQNMIGSKSVISTLFIFSVIALAFKPIERRIQFIIDKFIFKTTSDALRKENEQLMEAIKNQDRIKAVATLAAGMAHEIKNPLTAIKTFTEYLPARADDPDFIKEFGRIVSAEVGKIDGIVRQLLEFSKPIPPKLERTDIVRIVNDTLHLLNVEFVSHKISVIKHFYADKIWISGDKTQLQQVFLNLFLNSIQAMPNGGTLTTSILFEPDKLIKVCISDTGYGISKENLPHIFDPFFTTKEDGTGLGLAISHGILKEHGGKIKVKSELGHGTSFEIIFK